MEAPNEEDASRVRFDTGRKTESNKQQVRDLGFRKEHQCLLQISFRLPKKNRTLLA